MWGCRKWCVHIFFSFGEGWCSMSIFMLLSFIYFHIWSNTFKSILYVACSKIFSEGFIRLAAQKRYRGLLINSGLNRAIWAARIAKGEKPADRRKHSCGELLIFVSAWLLLLTFWTSSRRPSVHWGEFCSQRHFYSLLFFLFAFLRDSFLQRHGFL